jgi:hypothetical protein
MTMRNVIDAAGSPGMAPEDPPGTQRTASHEAVLLDGLEGVTRTGGIVATYLAIERGDHCPITPQNYYRTVARQKQQEGDHPLHCLPALRSRPFKISLCRVVHETPGLPGSARITRSVPVGRESTTSCPIDRSRRVTRLRVTALPTAFETINPTRVGSDTPRLATYSRACGVPTRRPVLTVERKSPAVTTRFARLSTKESTQSYSYAESSVRPLRRRAARIDRPARVRMRRRKPCTFARRRLFGWKVLLLIAVSPLVQLCM